MTADAYVTQLQALLPAGYAWSRAPDATLTKLLGAFADGLARVDQRAVDLQNEADPRTAAEMLADWERVCGLPDPCTVAAGTVQTLSQRRAAVVARLTTLGGQSAAYYRAVAAAIGFAIAVEEYSPHDVLSDVEAPLYDPEWQFAWIVQAANDTVIEFTVEDGADDPLATWGNAPLECMIRRLKPAHTTVLFGYDDYYVFPAGYWLGEYAAA